VSVYITPFDFSPLKFLVISEVLLWQLRRCDAVYSDG